MTPNTIPLNAIKTFESWSKLKVTILDFENSLTPYLPYDFFIHNQPCCTKIKNAGQIDKCISFDREFLYTYPSLHLEPRVHCCHAGFIEWSTVIYRNDQIAWIIFAGQRKLKKTLNNLITDKNNFPQIEKTILDKMQFVSDDESEFYKEGLCQLATRLNDWYVNTEKNVLPHAIKPKSPHALIMKINIFILEHHRDPIKVLDLANHLFLSESRTAHLVKELTGKTFIDKVTEIRLKTATNLLAITKIPITQVASQSGFNDISHFHRIFKKYKQTSPRLFRLEAKQV